MKVELTQSQIQFLNESLQYSVRHVEKYHAEQPTHMRGISQQRCADIRATVAEIKESLKNARPD